MSSARISSFAKAGACRSASDLMAALRRKAKVALSWVEMTSKSSFLSVDFLVSYAATLAAISAGTSSGRRTRVSPGEKNKYGWRAEAATASSAPDVISMAISRRRRRCAGARPAW